MKVSRFFSLLVILSWISGSSLPFSSVLPAMASDSDRTEPLSTDWLTYANPETGFLRFMSLPEGEAIRSELRDIASKMPEHYRSIFDATTRGYQLEEIAKMLGITQAALKWRKHAMIETLKQAWHTPVMERENIIRRMDQWPSVLKAI